MNLAPIDEMQPRQKPQVAVLIDGENVSVKYAEANLKRAKKAGELRVKWVFGNARMLPGWDDHPGFRFVHTGSGKNSADMKLAIDAMELVCSGSVDQFVIATSDSDFSHLAHALCERGLGVVGIGEYKAPAQFRNACTTFCCLNPPVDPPPVGAGDAKPCENGKSLDQKLVDLLQSPVGNGGIKIAQLNAVMRQRHDIRISTYEDKTWRGYLLKRAHLFRCDPKGPQARVYLAVAR